MPSEHRLHPSSILFALAGILKTFALPLLLLVITGMGGSSGSFDGWHIWIVFVLAFGVGSAVLRYLTFRLTYEGDELVIRSGILFRNERHVPYDRIQNLDATRGVAHRLFGVADVHVETGSGQNVEARISVLRESQFEEMRRRVFEGRASPGEPLVTHETGDTLLHLPPRELLLLGLLDNRGLLAIAAAYGVLWESGLQRVFWNHLSAYFAAPGAITSIREAFTAGQGPSFWLLAFMAAGLLGLLVVIRVLSMAWVSVHLHDFRLTAAGEDLRTEYGLFTRVTTTIPRRRIQSLTVVSTPLQRLCGRASIHVATAGSIAGAVIASRPRERLAPIVRAAEVPALVRQVLPTADIDSLAWQPLHPRAAKRASTPLLALHTAVAVGLFAVDVRLWPVPLAYLAICALPTVAVTRQHVRHIAWSLDEHLVAVRSGWLWRSVTVAPVAKIQSVTATESPFDRRAIMAAVAIDTAGGSVGLPRLRIPYLARDTAMALMSTLATRAAHTTFRW